MRFSVSHQFANYTQIDQQKENRKNVNILK